MILPPLIFTDNVPSDNNFDVEFYNVLGSSPATLNQITCNFSIGTSSGSPTVTISSTQGGTGVAIALAQSVNSSNFVGDSGSVALAIPANNSIWLRFTNCNGLGDGQVFLNGQPSIISLSGISSTDLMTMVRISLGMEVTPTEVNYMIRNARRFIQNRNNLRCMETDATLNLVSTNNPQKYAFSDNGMSNFKNLINMYVTSPSSLCQGTVFIEERDRSRFDKRISLNAICNEGIYFNIFESAFWFTNFSTNIIVKVEYYGYLSDSNATDGLYNDFPETLELLIQAMGERLRPNGDINKAMSLEKWASEKLVIEMHGDTEIKEGSYQPIKTNSGRRWR